MYGMFFIYTYMKHLKIFENHSYYSKLTAIQWSVVFHDHIERDKFRDFSIRSKMDRLLGRHGVKFGFSLGEIYLTSGIRKGVYHLPDFRFNLDICEDDDCWFYLELSGYGSIVYDPNDHIHWVYKCDNIEGIEQCLKDLKII